MNNTKITLFNADVISLDLLSFIFLLSIFFGIYVIISNNPVLSVLFLIGLFFTVSIYLMLLGLHFIGLSYLLIYVGAISMLFLFILMLINIRVSELFTDNRNSILLATLTILCFNFSVSDTLPQDFYIYNLFNSNVVTYIIDFTNNALSFQLVTNVYDYSTWVFKYLLVSTLINVAAKSWDSVLLTVTHISSMGNVLYTNLFILFILTSIILLLAMVGAIVITINKSTKIFSEPPLPKYATVSLESNDPLFNLVEDILSGNGDYSPFFTRRDLFTGIVQTYFPHGVINSDNVSNTLRLLTERYKFHESDLRSLNQEFTNDLATLSQMCAGLHSNFSHNIASDSGCINESYYEVYPPRSISSVMHNRIFNQMKKCDETFNVLQDSITGYDITCSRMSRILSAFRADNSVVKNEMFRSIIEDHQANIGKYLGLIPGRWGDPIHKTSCDLQPLDQEGLNNLPVFTSMRRFLRM